MRRAALAAATGLLVTILILEYYALRPEDAKLTPEMIRLPQAPSAAVQVPPGTAPEAQARVSDMLARPVFSASRRPPPGVASTNGVPMALPRLTAVLISARGRTVIFAGGQDAKPVALGEGGRIGAYVVQSIGAGQATLVGPDGPVVVRPSFSTQAAPGGASASSAPSIAGLLRQGTPVAGFPAFAMPVSPTGSSPR